MSKYVLRTVEPLNLPRISVDEVDVNGYGRAVAWFWNENEAREYMNLKEACAKTKRPNSKRL